MKRLIAWLLSLAMLTISISALAAEPIVFDQADQSQSDGCSVTADGRFILALRQYEQEYFGSDKFGGETSLLCLDPDGETLWEHKESKENVTCVYTAPFAQEDGSVAVAYVEMEEWEHQRWSLRRFSAQGELLEEKLLPESTDSVEAFPDGLLVEERTETQGVVRRSVSLLDEKLHTRWTLPDMRFGSRWDTMCRIGEETTLLVRDMKLSENRDGVRLLNVRDDGQILWSLKLSEQQSGFYGLALDAGGNRMVLLTELNNDCQSSQGELICVSPNGEALWRKPFELPEEKARFEMTGFCALDSGYALLVTTDTDTCLRLYRLDADGIVAGHTDWRVEEDEMTLAPHLLCSGGKLWAEATVVRMSEDGTSKHIVKLVPLASP